MAVKLLKTINRIPINTKATTEKTVAKIGTVVVPKVFWRKDKYRSSCVGLACWAVGTFAL